MDRNKTTWFGGVTFLLLFPLLSNAASFRSAKEVLNNLSVSSNQTEIQKTLGEPAEKNTEQWRYEFSSDSEVKEITINWVGSPNALKIKNFEMLMKKPLAPLSLIDGKSMGSEEPVSTGDVHLSHTAFKIPKMGLRLEFDHSKMITALYQMAPWKSNEPLVSLSAFTKTSKRPSLIQKKSDDVK